jgi:hypothetical protein
LFVLTIVKKPYFVQKFIIHLLIQCKTTLISSLGIASFIKQVLEINRLSLSSLKCKNLSCINKRYVLIT